MHALTIGRANPVSQPIELPTTHNERSTPAPNEWAAVSIGINLPPRFASECLAPVLARAHDRWRSVVLLLAHHQLAWSRPPFGERFHRDGEHGEFLTCLPSFFSGDLPTFGPGRQPAGSRCMTTRTEWTGTASELLGSLAEQVGGTQRSTSVVRLRRRHRRWTTGLLWHCGSAVRLWQV